MAAPSVGERLARLEQQMFELREDVHSIDRALNGPPREESFRGRLHLLETSDAAAKAAEAALSAVRVMQRESWSSFQKVLVTGAALVAAGVSVYNAIGG